MPTDLTVSRWGILIKLREGSKAQMGHISSLQILAMANEKHNSNSGIAIKEHVRTQKPPMYAVLLLNDDYTPMEFVVQVLEKYFSKDHASATELMLKVHNEGRALCGIYPYEIAETKVMLVTQDAQQKGHPLQCVLERA